MSEEKNGIFTQLREMDDDHLMQLLEKNRGDINKLMDNIIHKAALAGHKFYVMYNSLHKIEAFVKKQYFSYLTYCKQKSKKPVLSIELKDISVSDYEVPENSSDRYFTALYEIDAALRGDFFKTSDEICIYHIKNAVKLYFCVEPQIDRMVEELEKTMLLVVNPQGKNMFAIFMELLKGFATQPKDMKITMGQIKKILEFAEGIVYDISKEGIVIKEKCAECRSVYESFAGFFEETKSQDEKVQESLSPSVTYGFNEPVNMLQKILDFVKIDENERNAFVENLNTFKKLPDKKTLDDDVRKLRKTLSVQFYNLYEKVFLKAEEENVDGVVLDLFFNFGVVDDTMFSEKSMEQLKNLAQAGESNNVTVYTMKEWLHAIYTGKKDPSRNDLDMDYYAHVNDMARRGEITEEEKSEYMNRQQLKINYEIQNFMRMNSRLTNGELSVFCPVLTEESFVGDVSSMYVTDKMISDAVEWLLKADYSLFHREQLYDSRENGIVNMVISKQVFPDIILMPVVGSYSRMWQEIDGKRRDTPGRFTFPAFTKQDVKDLLVSAAGSFRWQLCKKIQGNYWNIVSEKSLTSEYYDYIQFYKKNRELSDQAKEKIGTQLQRARNNFADCFSMDYTIWIKNEVSGSVRLNKIVREIMATYCTPIKEIRENLKHQPMFTEAFSRFDREHNKKIKEIVNRRAAIRNVNGEETPEFVEEARFREEM